MSHVASWEFEIFTVALAVSFEEEACDELPALVCPLMHFGQDVDQRVNWLDLPAGVFVSTQCPHLYASILNFQGFQSRVIRSPKDIFKFLPLGWFEFENMVQ
jgi:hypothetical protein